MNLFVVCNDYPFGIGEPYFENELKVIAPGFSKVYIVLPEYANKNSAPAFFMPANAELVYLNITVDGKAKQKGLVKALFSADFYGELANILFKFGQSPTPARLKTLLNYFVKAELFKQKMQPFLAEKAKPGDVLYTYWCTEYTYAISQLKAAFGLKAITRMHGWDVYYERSLCKYLPLRNAIFKKLDAAFPVSKNGREYLLNKVGKQFDKTIQTAYLGTFEGQEIDTPKGNELHIVSLSNLVEVKRLPKIVDALALIEGLHIIWTHIGGGPSFDKFEKQVKTKLKDKRNIRYELLGPKTKEEVYSLLSSAGYHCLLSTSDYEGLPVSFMEALSFGIPILAPTVGGIPEIVEHNHNGLLMPIRPTPKAVAKAIEDMAKLDGATYAAMRKNAYQLWLEKFNAEENYKKFMTTVISLNLR